MSLVEREGQIQGFLGALGQAVTDRAQLMVVSGLAGHGTSTLLEHLGEIASSRGSLVLSASGKEPSTTAAGALVTRLVETGVSKLSPEDRPDALSGRASSLGDLWQSGPEGRSIDVAAIRRGLYWWLSDLTDLAPVAVIIDDAHCADATSLHLLAALVSEAGDLPVTFVVGVGRGAPTVDEASLSTLVRQADRVTDLDALSPAGVAEVLRNHGVDDRAHRDHVQSLGRGNPLLTTELARTLARGEPLPARLESDPGAAGSLGSVASSRLVGDRWPQVRPVVAAAAASRGRADVAMLAAELGQPVEQVQAAVVQLVDAQLLRFRGSRLEVVQPLVAAAALAEAPVAVSRFGHTSH